MFMRYAYNFWKFRLSENRATRAATFLDIIRARVVLLAELVCTHAHSRKGEGNVGGALSIHFRSTCIIKNKCKTHVRVVKYMQFL